MNVILTTELGKSVGERRYAVHRGDPEVRGAGVEDDGEILWWGANGDGAEVFHLQAREGRQQGVYDGVG